MHESSLEKTKNFVNRYLDRNIKYRILDVGSFDVNGTQLPALEGYMYDYVGLDIAEGKNVDVVVEDPYDWKELEDESFDIIISSNAFEHIEFPWLTMEQIKKKAKNGALIHIVVPTTRYGIHRSPVDTYRYHPDGLRALGKWVGFDVLEVNPEKSGGRMKSWDIMAIYQKL